MGLFDHSLDKAILIMAETIDRLTKQLYRCMWENKHKPHSVRWALITIINNQKFILMDPLVLDENTFDIAQNALFDTTTGLQIADAQFSQIVLTSTDETVAKVELLPDRTVKVTAIAGDANEPAVRPATINGKAQVSYTNNLGEPSTGQLLLTLDVQVKAVHTADGVEWRLIFGAPQVVIVPAP